MLNVFEMCWNLLKYVKICWNMSNVLKCIKCVAICQMCWNVQNVLQYVKCFPLTYWNQFLICERIQKSATGYSPPLKEGRAAFLKCFFSVSFFIFLCKKWIFLLINAGESLYKQFFRRNVQNGPFVTHCVNIYWRPWGRACVSFARRRNFRNMISSVVWP